MSCARCGSSATKAMSHTPDFAAAVTLPAASNGISSTGTPSRLPSSSARSTDTPAGRPAASLYASTGLPKLIAARRLPLGARSEAAPEGGVVEQEQRKITENNSEEILFIL